jgi:hypothetical protein
VTVGFRELSATGWRGTRIESDLGQPAVGYIFNVTTVQIQTPCPTLSAALRIVLKLVAAGTLLISATAEGANLDGVVEIQVNIRIAFGLLDEKEDLMHRVT